MRMFSIEECYGFICRYKSVISNSKIITLSKKVLNIPPVLTDASVTQAGTGNREHRFVWTTRLAMWLKWHPISGQPNPGSKLPAQNAPRPFVLLNESAPKFLNLYAVIVISNFKTGARHQRPIKCTWMCKKETSCLKFRDISPQLVKRVTSLHGNRAWLLGRSQVWWTLFLRVLSTSASTCLQCSRNLETALESSPVYCTLSIWLTKENCNLPNATSHMVGIWQCTVFFPSLITAQLFG